VAVRGSHALHALHDFLDGLALSYYRNTMPTITFKVSAREAARIRELARREGLTVSEFLRRRAVSTEARAAAGEYRIAEDPLTGLPVMEAPAGTAPVSSEQIRAMLADFP
jgi:hypothetical protein